MSNTHNLSLFEGKKIRKIYDETREKWYFSVIDIVGVLMEQDDPQKTRKYWNKLAERLRDEGSELVTNCHQLKMIAQDGKMRLTDVADVETLLRLIQSVPSKKAEPIKLWLARVGYERMQEIADPEKSIDRARENWIRAGRSEKWITQRMSGQETRNKLTDYWADNGVKKGDEFAILTNIIHSEWTGLSVKDHKNLKNLKSHNLRDHMTEAELIFTSLAELSTRQIAEAMQTKGLAENKIPAKKGGQVARNARKELETKTGKSVVSGENFLKSGKQKEIEQ
ncbi:MAG: BRO family protein [Candidatus Gracilibacteria bacterium]